MDFSVLKKFIYIFLVAVLLLTSCDNWMDEYQPNFGGEEYFPLKIGNTWIYQLDSVLYDNMGEDIDTISQFLKERITDSFIDGEGNYTFRIERSLKKDSSDQWEVYEIWSAYKNDRIGVKNEGNMIFVKLNFPVKIDKNWDGNAFINEDIEEIIAGNPIKIYENWGEYQYTNFSLDEKIDNVEFHSVSTVIQADNENNISRRFAIEKFAKDLGLIYKKMIILNTQQFDNTEPWTVKAEEGFILEQKLLNFTPG